MPKYYVNILENGKLIKDREGTEADNVEAMIADALQSAREMMAANVLAGKEPDGRAFEICDETGRVLTVVPFRSALHSQI
jgi:hypothetical protein